MPEGFKQRFTPASTSLSCCFTCPLFLTLCSCWVSFPLIKNTARWARITRSLLVQCGASTLPGRLCPWGWLPRNGGQGGLVAVGTGEMAATGLPPAARDGMLSALWAHPGVHHRWGFTIGHLGAGAVTLPGPGGISGWVREPAAVASQGGCCGEHSVSIR